MNIKPQTKAHKDYILKALSHVTGLEPHRVKFGRSAGSFPVLAWVGNRSYFSHDGITFYISYEDGEMVTGEKYHGIRIHAYTPK